MGGSQVNMLGLCCCGCAPAPMPVPRFTNVTTVNGGAAPYMRPWEDCSSGACISATCGGVGEPVCYNFNYDGTPFVFSEGIKGVDECTGGALVSRILDNCYSHDGSTMYSIDTHCGQGWKGVAASKIWQGQFGFVDSGSPCCYDGGLVTNKYKTQAISEHAVSHYRQDTTGYCDGVTPDSFVEQNYTHDVQQTASVDDYGNLTRIGSISMESSVAVTGGASDSYLSSCLLEDCTGAGGGIDGYTYPNGAVTAPGASLPMVAECGIITVGFPSGHAYYTQFPEISGTPEELNALEIGKSPTVTTYVDAGGRTHTLTVVSNQPATFTLSDDRIEMSMEMSHYDTVVKRDCDDFPDDFNQTTVLNTEYSKVVTLGGEMSYADVIGQANGMLGEWNLTDDLQYPFRTDGAVWLLPFLTLDEGGSQPTIDLTQSDCPASARSTVLGVEADCTGCRFTDVIGYTGELRGAPLPNGYGPHFNHHHIVWEVCCNAFGIGGACHSGLGERGASPLPIAATQWTDYAAGWDMRGPGAHVSQYAGFAQAPMQAVTVQKWAETLNAWPSENMARPASRDRYLFDETDVACGSVAGTDLTLSTAPATPFSAGEKIASGSIVYSITGGSGLAYTLSAPLYDTPIPCDGAARLRYPSARAIMSTLTASCVQTSPGLVTVTTLAKHRLKGGGSEQDTVTFTGIGGLTTAAATVVDEYNFTVSGTLTTSPSSGTISDGGSALDSTCSTHSFLYRTFQSNYRAAYEDGDPQYSVTETMVSIAPTNRHPTVICISPNGESFPHGITYGFGTIGADMCHGEDWSANILQAVPSPYWQAPHIPCGHTGGWTQAALPCATPTSDEYAFPPLVEPRLSAPWTATDGLYFGGYAYPGAVGRGNCSTAPHENSHPPQWYPSWLTCDDWKELIGNRC